MPPEKPEREDERPEGMLVASPPDDLGVVNEEEFARLAEKYPQVLDLELYEGLVEIRQLLNELLYEFDEPDALVRITLVVGDGGARVIAWGAKGWKEGGALYVNERLTTPVLLPSDHRSASTAAQKRDVRRAITTAFHHTLLKRAQVAGEYRRRVSIRRGTDLVQVITGPVGVLDDLRNAIVTGVADEGGIPEYEKILASTRPALIRIERDRSDPSKLKEEARERSLCGFSEDFVRSIMHELADTLPDPMLDPEGSNAVFAWLAAATIQRCPDKQTHDELWTAWEHATSERLEYQKITRRRVFRFQHPSLELIIRSTNGTEHPVDAMWFPGTTLYSASTRARIRRQRDERLRPFSIREGDTPDIFNLSRLVREDASVLRTLRDSVIDGNLQTPFEGLFLDVDGVLVDTFDDQTSPVATRLRGLATAGVPIAICSGGELERIEKLLDPPSSFPGLTIYAKHGATCVRSDGVSWVPVPGVLDGLTEDERTELHASYVKIKSLTDKREGLSKQSRALVNTVVPKPESYAASVSSIHRREHGDTDVPRAKLALLARELQEADSHAIEKLPGRFQVYMNGSSVQIIPAVLTKESCLAHFEDMLRRTPGRKEPVGRIMRIGDQGSALEGRDDRYTSTYLPIAGVDAGILNCADGFSTHYESEHGNPPPADEITGRPLIKTDATRWLLDRASFQILHESGSVQRGAINEEGRETQGLDRKPTDRNASVIL